MAKAPVAIKTASVLAFERKLATSDAVMYAGNWQGNEWQPIEIQEKAVRGTISNRLKNAIASDPTKLDAEIQKANLQRVDVASLPVDTDTLKVVFTLRVLGNLSTPSVCNDMAYQEALSGVIEGYISEHGFKELALRYALNLANGRFLWRNRIGAEQIQWDNVVCGLCHVDVVIRVDNGIITLGAAQDFDGAVCDDFVCVHISTRSGAALDAVNDELVF